MENLIDIEDAAGGLPQLLDDAQHQHVRAAQAREQEALKCQHALDGGGACAEQREGEQLHSGEEVKEGDAEEGELALHRAEALAARLPQALHRLVHDRRHTHRGHVHNTLEGVLGRPRGEQLGRRDIEAAEVVLDVLADAAQGGLVEWAALAHERRLLEQRLRLGHLLE